jgi:Mg/Co/Ni transporter MgtE
MDSSTLGDIAEERRTERFGRIAHPKLAQAIKSTDRVKVIAIREEVKKDVLAAVAERLSEWYRGSLKRFAIDVEGVKYDEVRLKVSRMYGKTALTTIRRFFDLEPEDLEDSRGELDSDAFLLVTALYCVSSCGRVLVLTSDEKARSLLNSALDRLREHPSLGSVFEKVSEP